MGSNRRRLAVLSILTESSRNQSTCSSSSLVQFDRKEYVVCGVVQASKSTPVYQVAAPSQLHLPQYGVDAEDSGPLQDLHVRDPVLPSQLQYSAKTAEMNVIQLPGLVQDDHPGLRSVQECFGFNHQPGPAVLVDFL
ncbi:unnamed protein product [Schistocephalus solidus]|uniref:Late endosomal/lysosomal adaptor and MAPK and MTOR activator 1 n=1 Tax=Schistocephalus solidus TaxID=70667 RepID=A0A183TKS9_SCHSO|nr:unnamed protein product [Schistocephalus solidus]